MSRVKPTVNGIVPVLRTESLEAQNLRKNSKLPISTRGKGIDIGGAHTVF